MLEAKYKNICFKTFGIFLPKSLSVLKLLILFLKLVLLILATFNAKPLSVWKKRINIEKVPSVFEQFRHPEMLKWFLVVMKSVWGKVMGDHEYKI